MMPATAFSAEQHTEDGDTVLTLHGDINRAAQAGLTSAHDDAKQGSGRLLLDFSDVAYINSTGIALIVQILADCRTTGREVAAYGLTDHYREIFSITRLSDFMTIYADEAAALTTP
ncbi:MAG: STAS domain-containing protein [Actinomycetota bacterium]